MCIIKSHLTKQFRQLTAIWGSVEVATLTTIDGRQVIFSPSSVTIITDYDVLTHAFVTSVYGVRNAVLQISETPQEFLVRINIQNNIAQLTRPTGRRMWINANAVTTLSEPLPNSYVDGVKTVIEVGLMRLGVAESLEEATRKINDHRATPLGVSRSSS